jgi:predicted TIM-barrel fold metal-dependent hydrolase
MMSHICPICSRRHALAAMAGAGAMAAFGGSAFAAGANPRRIDTHCHVVPPAFVTAHHMENVDEFKVWSVARQLEEMDKYGVETGIQGLNSPGVDLVDEAAAAKLARDCNEYATKVMNDHPGRYGTLIALPLLHVDASLKELAYGMDTLKGDGVSLVTSYQGKLISEPMFEPVMAELNRRKAVVFPHPQTLSRDRSMNTRVLEMPYDTGRAILDMVVRGHFTKYPDIKWIFAHGGGALPILWERAEEITAKTPDQPLKNGLANALKNVHFDVIGVANKLDFQLVSGLWGNDRLTFGTDWPFVQVATTADHLDALKLPAADAYKINRGNAEKLFPRFAKA